MKKHILYIVVVAGILSIFSASSTFADNVDYSVTIEPSLTLTIPSSSVVLDLDPASKTYDSKSFPVSVATNNITGYKLSVSTTGDITDLTRDISSDTTTLPTYTIPTLDSGSSYSAPSDFPANKWGYKKDSGNYIPFSSPTPLLENTTATNGDTTTLSFASKIDYTLASGAYKTTLIFTATTNPMVNYMQDLNSALCTTTPMTVVDKRDNQEYVIQRLADGNCWMMTNLNLGATALTTDLTSANTNLSTTVTAAKFNGWKKSSGTATSTAGEYIPVSGTDSTSQTPYGTLYNYCATSAGTICTSSNSSNAQYDICPKGWRLPTGGSSGEFQTLYNNASYNTYAKMRAPYTSGGAAFALAGIFSNAVPVSQDSSGNYWSSTRLNDTAMHRLNFSTSSVSPANYGHRYGGGSIRCILNDPRTISDITTMQEMSPQIAAKMNNGDTATLKDSRDGQDYTIAKINGNVWMTRNLAIGCNGTGSTYGSTTISRTLTPNDTHVATSYSTPVDNDWSFSYDNAEQVCDSTYGAWYNYVASSAGTISGSSNSVNASYDICPKEWRLPTLAEVSRITSGANITLFNRVLGGGYYGTQKQTETRFARWWTSTYGAPTTMYVLYYDPGTVANVRDSGYYVRCIAK